MIAEEHKLEKNELEVVNHLIKICNERISGFNKAAEEIDDNELKSIFLNISLQTEGLCTQLLDFINETKIMHQEKRLVSDIWETWMSLKSNFTHGNKVALIKTCLIGESAAIQNYKNALDKNISVNLRQVIGNQLDQLENTYKNLKAIINDL